jgi:hypothetical protein
MDKFEEHIKRARQDLDMYNPPSELWNKIEKGLKKEKSINWKWLSVAAIVIVVLGFATLLLKPSFNIKNNNEISNADGNNPVTPQLSETEIYYNNLVSALYREAAPLLTTNPEINKELTEDLSRLDSISSDIRKDLKENIANQEVVEALIQNYRIKIRLLEDILNLLKENDGNPGKSKKYEL